MNLNKFFPMLETGSKTVISNVIGKDFDRNGALGTYIYELILWVHKFIFWFIVNRDVPEKVLAQTRFLLMQRYADKSPLHLSLIIIFHYIAKEANLYMGFCWEICKPK